MRILFYCIIILLICNCEYRTNQSSNAFSFVPNKTSIIIKTNNITSLQSDLKNNLLIKEIVSYNQIKNLQNNLRTLEFLNLGTDILICLSKNQKDSLQFAIITKYDKSVFKANTNLTTETLTIESNTIYKTMLNKQMVYSAIHDNIAFISNELALVEASFTENSENAELEKVYNSASNTENVSVLINTTNTKKHPVFFKNKRLNTQSLTNYLLVDANITQDQILCNGITKAVDSSQSLINVFKHTIPQENQISKISPANTDAFLSVTFDSYEVFQNNLSKFNHQDSITPSHIFDNVFEIGTIFKNETEAVVLNSIDPTQTAEALNLVNSIETYRNVEIFTFSTPQLFNQKSAPFIVSKNVSKCINIDGFFVFADDVDVLKHIISSYQNNATLSQQAYFKNIMLNMSDESSLFMYANNFILNDILNANFNEDLYLKIDNQKASAIQFIYDNNFAHVNAVFKKRKSKGALNSISEEINIKIDADLLTAPQLVTNHKNKQKDIVLQDVNNNLYLISNKGQILWKKQLQGKILGKIEQIDSYKNGRLQLVFATPNQLHVIDRNGNDVKGFPLQFENEITQPLSVFDYDKKKNYRLLITQNGNLKMFDKTGKTVSGFVFNKTEKSIVTQPKHFKVGNKDYIVFAQGNTLKILSRTGDIRIDVNDNIAFSGNDIYLYKNKFTTTNTSSTLVQVNAKGKLNTRNLNLTDKHQITTTNKTLVALSENKLRIKSKTIELDFGNYTVPKIFYINDKIYVTTTDLQSKKIYLFDSLAKPITNFPVYGNSSIELDNIDDDKNLEVITKSDTNALIIYQIN